MDARAGLFPNLEFLRGLLQMTVFYGWAMGFHCNDKGRVSNES